MDAENYTPEILYEDASLLVCVKEPGTLSEPAGGKGLPDLLTERLRAQGKPCGVLTVHRLDRNVGGLMVFAREKKPAGKLIADVAARKTEKEYYAVLRGVPEQDACELEDLLFRDASKNKSYVVKRMRKGVRDARLSYRLLQTVKDGETELSLVRIRLHTGRTHQIRVQFSSRQLPLLGDIRYGSKDARCDVSLWSCMLAFRHPEDGRKMRFYRRPPDRFPWSLFSAYTAVSPFPDNPGESVML